MARPKIFISYAHQDEPEHPRRDEVQWLTYIRGHLGPLERAAALEVWADTNLTGGQDWEQRIFSAIEACDIFILLVSPHALRSDFIIDREIPALLARQKRNSSTEWPLLYPIVITPCAGLDHFSWLKRPNRRPKDGKALSTLERTMGINQRDPVVAQIADEISRIVGVFSALPRSPVNSPPISPVARKTPVDARGVPVVSGAYDAPPAMNSQEPRPITLRMAFSGLSKITTEEGMIVFTLQQVLLQTEVMGGRISHSLHTLPRSQAVVTPIVTGRHQQTLKIQAIDQENGLEGEVLAPSGAGGGAQLFEVLPQTSEITVNGKVVVEPAGIAIDLERSSLKGRRPQGNIAREKRVAELAKLVLCECGGEHLLEGGAL